MARLSDLFEKNEAWAKSVEEQNPDFFDTLAKGQSPRYLWIGCSDSRVPASVVTGMGPCDIFVHRTVANVIENTDLNMLSVVQYAVEVLKVQDVIVCGHYGCGGVTAALHGHKYGPIDNWLRNIKNGYQLNAHRFDDKSMSDADRVSLMCEVNVAHQVTNLCATTIVQDAWARGQDLAVHGVIFDLASGRINDLDLTYTSDKGLPPIYKMDS